MSLLDGWRSKRRRKLSADPPGKRAKHRRPLGIMALEPRVMYDAAAAATAASAAHHHHHASDAGHADKAAAGESHGGSATQDAAQSTMAPSSSAHSAADAPVKAAGNTASASSDASASGAGAPTAPKEIVIIDGSVPDLQTLVNGVKPGDRVFILDPSKDGVQQIADIIKDNDLHDLTAIQIVSHGLEAQVRLGSTVLTDGNLAAHADALNAIGAALAPGGDIMFYGCYVGIGEQGQQFLADLSGYTGGANIAASSDPVGTTAAGVDWTLEVATGPVEATVPFTAAALAAFDGTLVNPVTGQFWYLTVGNSPSGDSVLGYITNSDSATAVVKNLFDAAQPTGYAVAVDTAAGYYFVANTDHLTISSYRISDGALIEKLQVGNPNGGGSIDDDLVGAIAVDPINHVLFVNRWDGTSTGIVKVTYDPATGDLNNNGAYDSGSQQFLITNAGTTAAYDGTHGYTFGTNFEIDITTHKLYYTDWDNNFTGAFGGANFVPTNAIYVVSDYTAASPTVTKLTSQVQFPTNASNGFLGNIAVDNAKGLVYFTTLDFTDPGQGHIWYMPIAGGTAVKIADLDNLHIGDSVPAGLSIDQQNHQIYISTAYYDPPAAGAYPNAPTADANHVLVYQLSADGHSFSSLVASYSMTNLIGHAPIDTDEHPSGSTFDVLPTLTVTGTSTHASEQGSAIDLTASSTSSDTDGGYYSGATVQITGGTFAGDGDLLAANTAGTSITANYVAATHTLTLSGYDTIAHYNTVLAGVTYQSTGDNPTNYGNNTTRTITWVVSDGALNIAVGAQNSAQTTITIDAVNDNPVNNLPSTPSIDEDVQTAITGISMTDVDADPANQDITVTLSVQHGTLNVLTNVAGGIIGADITGGAQDSTTLTITATQNQINATIAGSGLRYLSDANYNGPDTLHIVTSDGGHTGSGGTQGDTDNLGITVNPVDDAPVFANVGPSPTVVEQTAGLLDSNVTVSDAELDALNGGNGDYAGASLTLARSGGANGQDSFAFDTAGASFTVSGGNLQAGGNTFATFTNSAGTLTINFTGAATTATTALANDVLERIAYTNTDNDPPASVTLAYAFNDGNANGAFTGLQGIGGAGIANASIGVTITPVNDAPTLSASAANPNFTEAAGLGTQAAAVTLFTGANASATEASQTIVELDLAVSGLLDGANEKIVIDGSTIALGASSSGTTATNGMNYAVTVTGSTATVALTKAAGIGAAAADTLINGIKYQDTNADNPTAGNRVFTLTSIKDNGGTANGGVDTAGVSIASTVNVSATNDNPVATITPASYGATEQVSLNLKNNGLAVSDVDSNGGVETATLSVGEGTLTVTAGTSGATVLNSGSASVTISGTVAQINALLNSDGASTVSYIDNTDTPSAGTTLTLAVNDNGHSGAGGALPGTAAKTINITAVDDAPVVTVLPPQSVGINGDLAFSAANGNLIALSDPDSSQFNNFSVSVSAGSFSITADGITYPNAASFSTNGNTRTLADLNAFLATIVYHAPATVQDVTLTVFAQDTGGVSTTANTTIHVDTLGVHQTITLTGDTDGDGVADPGETVTTTVTITNNSGSTVNGISFDETLNGLTQTGNVNASPIALNDSFTDVGNTQLIVNASGTNPGSTPADVVQGGLFANDFEFLGDTFSLKSITGNAGAANFTSGSVTTTTAHGSVTVNADGTFTYTPAAGFTGTDSFTYTITDGGLDHNLATAADNLISTATATITVSNRVWYVDFASATNGDGTSANPFNGYGPLNGAGGSGDVDSPNDIIYLHTDAANQSPFVNTLTLEDGQQLIGSGAALVVNGTTLQSAGTKPGLNFSGNGIVLAQDNRISGLDIWTGSGGTAIIDNGGTVGNLTISNVNVPTRGTIIDIRHGGNLDVAFGSTANQDAGGAGIHLSAGAGGTLTGSFSVTNGAIGILPVATPSGIGIQIGDVGVANSGGTFSFSFGTPFGDSISATHTTAVDIENRPTGAGDITISAAVTGWGAGASGIIVNNVADGTITFGSLNLANTSANAIQLTNNAGATIDFSGAVTVANTSGIGFNATGGGTITAAGINISTQTGQLVHMDGVDIGSGGLTFGTLQSTGTVAADAISLNNVDGLGLFNGGNVTVAATSGAGSDGIAITGGSAAAFSFASATLGSNTDAIAGAGLNLNGANGAVTFTTVNINNTGGAGVSITGNTNAVSINGGSIGGSNDPAAQGVLISGGSGGVSIAASLTKTTAGKIVDIQSRTAGTVTLSGNLSATGGVDNGINVASNSGGTINFSGASKVLTTAAAAAVNLGSNGGATVNFTGGGLAINTTSGTGFNATGPGPLATSGGTVTVQGSGNTITSTTGTALNVVNTTIGAAGLTFQSISANGAAKGIVLNNTGSSGGLTVTGTGTTDGSGGTIQNNSTRGVEIITASNISLKNMNFINSSTTDGAVSDLSTSTANAAIYLSSVSNVTLDNINISGTNQEGINGLSVHNFSLNNSTIDHAGDEIEEGAIKMRELTGTATITNSTLSFSGADNVEIVNSTGNLTLNVDNSIFSDTQASSSGNTGIQVRGTNPGDANFVINIANSQFLRIRTHGLNVQALGTGSADVDVTGNIFDADTGTMIGMSLEAANSANLVFNIIGNTKVYSRNGPAINIFGDNSAHVEGRINDNSDVRVLDGTGVGTGSEVGAGIRVNLNKDSTGVIQIDNNDIMDFGSDGGIEVSTIGQTNANTGQKFQVSITNNTVNMDDGIHTNNTTYGVFLLSASGAGEHNVMVANVQNNAITNPGIFAFRARNVDAGGTLQMQGFNTDPGHTWDIRGNTPTGSTSFGGSGTFGAGTPALPSNPLPDADPLMLAPGGIAPPATGNAGAGGDTTAQADTTTLDSSTSGSLDQPADDTSTPTDTAPPTEDGSQVANVNNGVLTQAELETIVDAAIQRWAATGLSAAQLAYLQNVNFTLADLAGMTLGAATAGQVAIDLNAAGNGWFIDPTPMSDAEFASNVAGALYTTPDQAPAGHVDLLTTVLHELGHELGLDDTYASADRASLMYGYIVDGQRRLPVAGEADGAIAGNIVGQDFLLAPVNIGSLPTGTSVTIQFQETVDAQTDSLIVNPTNFGTVTFTGGSADSNSVTTTVDSLTLGNQVFLDNDFNGTFGAGDSGIDGVALTLYADSNANGSFDPGTDAQIATATTANNGLYSFAGLAPGNYIVRLDQSNFNAGGPLVGLGAASGGADPDNDSDTDSNGVTLAGQGVVSHAITLAYNSEPTNDSTGHGDINNTLDFGFVTDQPPVVSGAGNTVNYTEQQTGPSEVIVDSAITVSDADNTDLAGATVTIGNFLAGDELKINGQLTGSIGAIGYNYSAGVLTLTGTDTVANYQAALRLVTFDSTGDDPTNGGNTSRTITWVANDGLATGAPATSTVDVTAVNDAPANTAPAAVSTNEDVSLNFTGGNTIGISDVDADGGDETVTLTVTDGTLHLGSTAGLTSFSNDAASISLTGTLSNVNSALASLSYLGGTNFNGSDTLSILTSDNGHTGVDPSTLGQPATGTASDEQAASSVDITVNPVNDAPAVDLNGAGGGTGVTLGYSENDAPTAIAPAGLVDDVDSANFNGGSLTVSFTANGAAEDQLSIMTDGQVSVSSGVVSVNGLAIGTVTGGANAVDLVVNFNTDDATPIAVSALIEHVAYANTSENPSTAARTVTFTVVDGDGNTNGGADTGNAAATVNVTSVNDKPALAAPSQLLGLPFTPFAIDGIVFSDVDDGGGIERAHITRDDPASTLAASTSGGVTATSDGSGGFFLDGTIAALNSYIAADNVTLSAGTSTAVHVSLDDQGHTGTPGAQTSDTSDITIVIDIPPVLSNAGSTVTYTEQQTSPNAVVLESGITLADADGSQANGAIVTITSGAFAGDVLDANFTGNISLSWNGTDTLTLSGGDTIAHYQQVLQSVTFASTSNNPTDFGNDLTRTISWIVKDDKDVASAPVTTTVNIIAVNDPAVLSADVRNLTETNSAADISSSGILTISDVDNNPATFTPQAGTAGSYGTFAIDANGAWTYTASSAHDEFVAGTTYTDTFDVTSNDGTHTSVTVNVLGTNDPALISGTTAGAVTEAGGVANGTVNTPTASATLTDTDVDNPANSFMPVNAPAASDNGYGTFTMTAGGTWGYTLDNDNAAVQALNNGGTLNDSFTVSTIDGTTQQIAIVINGANDSATISGTTTGDVTEAGGVANGTLNTPTASSTLTDTDVDNPANTFTPVNAPAASDSGYGTFTMTAGGIWTYSLDNANAAVQALNDGQTLSDSFTVSTVDGTTQQIAITIHGSNDAAVVSGTVTGDVTEAGGIANATPGAPTASATLTDTDVDNPANSFTAVNTPAASDNGYGTFTMTAGGTWTFTVDDSNAAVQALNGGGTLTDTFTVHTVDGTAQQVTVTIHGQNDAPVVTAGNVLAYNANLGSPVAIDPVIDVSDVDSSTLTGATVKILSLSSGDQLTFTDQGGITGVYDLGTATLTLTGTASVAAYKTALASVAFQSNSSTSGVRTIEWQVDDGSASGNLSAVATSTIDVQGVVHPQSLVTIPHSEQPNGTQTTGTSPLGNQAGSTPILDLVGNGGHFTLNNSIAAVYFVNAKVTSGDVTGSIGPDGGHLFTARVPLLDLVAPLGGATAVQIFAAQANGDPLPDWLHFDPATGLFSGEIPADSAGKLVIEVVARDSSGHESVLKFTIDLTTGEISWNESLQRMFGQADWPARQAAIELQRAAGGKLAEWFGGRGHATGADVAPRGADADFAASPRGRAGLSEQLKAVGWQAMHSRRLALLESLRQHAAGPH